MAAASSRPRETLRASLPQESTSRRIVAAARCHFLAHGFRAVTMDDLAVELGMSKKTLYASFTSKEKLLEAVLVSKFHDIDADLRKITSDCSDVPAALHRLVACVQRHTTEIQPSFVRDMRREPDLFEGVERRRRAIIRRYFSRVFEAGRKAGIVRHDVPTRLIIEILLAAVQGILNPSKMAELDLTPKTGFTSVIRVVLQGVLSERGKVKL